MPHNTRYSKFKSKGLCGRCGSRPPLPDKVLCQKCSDSDKARYRKDRKKRLEQMAKWYQKNKVYQNELKNKRRHEIVAMGLCAQCYKPAPLGRWECLECSDKKNHRDRERRSKNPEKYRAITKAVTKKRREGGKCTACGIPLDPTMLEQGLVTCGCKADRRNGSLRNYHIEGKVYRRLRYGNLNQENTSEQL